MIVTSLLALMLAVGTSYGTAKEYDFKDPKGVNAIHFLLDSELEPILGIASGVSGTVSYDPEAPEKTTGKLVVDAKTLHTQNPAMKEQLHSDKWLDVEKYPTIEFKFKQIEEAKPLPHHQSQLKVVGDFTCKGITKELTIPVRATHLAGKLGERLHGKVEGDLLVLRADFTIKRSDFEIAQDAPAAIVADEIKITAFIVGGAPEPKE